MKKIILRILWYFGFTLWKKKAPIIPIKLIAFSGSHADRIEYMNEKYDVLKYFYGTHFSHDIGYNKYDERFFTSAIKKFNLPDGTIYVDNNQDFLDIGKKFGFKTILFKNYNDINLILWLQLKYFLFLSLLSFIQINIISQYLSFVS